MSIYSILSLGLINAVSVMAGRVVLALYALHFGAQPHTVGLLAATFAVLPTFFAWQAGRLADRFGARWLLVIGGSTGALGLLIAWLAPGLPAIFVAAATVGLSFAIYNVSLQNLVGVMSSAENRTQYFSNYSLMNSVAQFAGPLLGGWSIDHFSHRTTCLFLMALSLLPVAMLILRGGLLPGGTPAAKRRSGGVRTILAGPGVRRVLIATSVLQSGWDLFQFYVPVYTHGIGMSASVTGTVIGMSAAASFVVRFVLSRLVNTFTAERVLGWSFVLVGLSFVLVPFFTHPVALVLIGFIYGLGAGCGQPVVTMLMYQQSPEGRSGEALGLRLTVNYITRLTAPVAFGFIASAFGLAAVFWVNAAMMAAGRAFRPRPGVPPAG
jgi:MFS family permease